MPAKILYGKEYAAVIKESVRREVEEMSRNQVKVGLAVIIVGDDAASQVYVRNKRRACLELGIRSEVIMMSAGSTKEEILSKIDELNAAKDIHGILVQLPLPDGIRAHTEEILQRINPLKDVDGFHPVNVGKLVTGSPALVPCTPAGCLEMLDIAGIEVEGKRAVIVGRSNIVGKPLIHLLLARNATVTVCHSYTKDLGQVTSQADILVVAIGRARYITSEMIKRGAVVVDVGINRIAPGKLVGDVDFERAIEVAGAITPVPGGVGLITVAELMRNVVKAAKLQTH